MIAKLKGLLVGAGSMGSMHLRVLTASEDVSSIALVEPDARRREAVAKAYPNTSAHGDLSSALERERPDFACAAVPVADSPRVAAQVIDAGVPLLLEKPMAPSVGEAREIAERARQAGVLLSVGYVERFNPAVQALKDELERETAGAVYHAHARRLSPFPQRPGLPGVAIDLATHDLDVISHLIQAPATRIYAETSVLGISDGEDLVCASVRYENGVTGLIEANWHTPTKVRELSVTAEGGMFVVSYLTQDLYLHEQPRQGTEWETLGVMRGANEGRTIRFAFRRREPLVVEWEAFLSAVRRDGPAPVAPEDGIAALAAARAIVQAGATQQPVEGFIRDVA